MEFLKNTRLFDFLYGDKSFWELPCQKEQTVSGNVLTTVYALPDGLKITNIATRYENAYEWVNYFENTGSAPTEILSDLWDCKVTLPMPHEDPMGWTADLPDTKTMTKIYAPQGSVWEYNEFSDFPDRSSHNRFVGHLAPGEHKAYSAFEGLSSGGQAPFFNVHKDGAGYIFAIGWTGQWHCHIARSEDDVTIQTKIQDTHFQILPGEKFRTSSVVIMPYQCNVVDSQNQWRRLVKQHFSLIGKPGRDSHGPLCAGIWGGMKTEYVLDRLDVIVKNNLPVEYLWMDAGWYGEDTQPSLDEYEGDWFKHAGQWCVSSHIHPGGLRDVSQAIHRAGKKFLLWFEPERALRNAPITGLHPEYFLFPSDEKNDSLILNLGNEAAWHYCVETVAALIETIGVDCYRQDFNVTSLAYWQENDTPQRQGMTEILYINGLYRFWDALLERFPHLLIDNCSGGGRRIDIETLQRSVPLWRSDFQCPANYCVNETQCHNLGFSGWMPFSGTGTGRAYDTYRFRSAFSPALTTNYTFSARETFGNEPEKLAWLKTRQEEYLQVRPYMSEDYYPLTEVSDRSDIWCASQFHRPGGDDGIVLVFRRENAPYTTAEYPLFGLEANADYVFTDADTGAQSTFSGKTLTEQGLPVNMKEKRSSRLYFYKKA